MTTHAHIAIHMKEKSDAACMNKSFLLLFHPWIMLSSHASQGRICNMSLWTMERGEHIIIPGQRLASRVTSHLTRPSRHRTNCIDPGREREEWVIG